MAQGEPEALSLLFPAVGDMTRAVPGFLFTKDVMRNLERLLALALIVVGAGGFYAATGLSLWDEYTVGPGAAPLAYGAILMVCSAAVAFKPPTPGAIEWGSHFPRAVLLLALVAGLALSIGYVGFTGGLVLFSFAALAWVARIKIHYALLLAAIWVAMLYGVFVRLLNIPFPRGVWF